MPATPIPVGKTFGKRTVLGRAVKPPREKRVYVRAQCVCGRIDDVRLDRLRRDIATSCMACRPAAPTKHGASNTPEYGSWQNMRSRCLNATNPRYANYGGRGITICPEWESFDAFLRDMGPRPTPEHSLDRHPDNDGPYAPWNCRWATDYEQSNNRSFNHTVEAFGRQQNLSQWALESPVDAGTIRHRILQGWTPEKAIITPANAELFHFIEFRGETLHLAEGARRAGISPGALKQRLKRGWSVERALTTAAIPVGQHRKGKQVGEHG